MKILIVLAQPKPEDDWLHRFRNLGEAVWVQLGMSEDASIEEIDASWDLFHVRCADVGVAHERTEAITQTIRKHNLDDSVFVVMSDRAISRPAVAAVLDPTLGNRIEAAALGRPVWVVPSDANRAAVREIWDASTTHSVTLWSRPFTTLGEEEWRGIVGDIELHHHGVEKLDVYGAEATTAARAVLPSYGYGMILPTPIGFIALKCEITPP